MVMKSVTFDHVQPGEILEGKVVTGYAIDADEVEVDFKDGSSKVYKLKGK